MKIIKRLFALLSFLSLTLSFLILIVPGVLATGEGSLGAYPTNYDASNPKTKSWFIYELKPGETKDDSITVVNNSDSTINVKIYPVDATTTSDGAFALLNENQRQTDIGNWVNIAKDIVTIEPRGHKDVPFTITIPKFATVGDHAGGIIVQQATQANTQSQGIGLNIVSRVGTRIYETVPGGQVVKLDVQNFTYSIVDNHLVFSFVMENQGNVILTPSGRLDIKDISGKVIDTIPLGNLGSVFPNKPTTLTAKSHVAAPWFGRYSATVTINYSNTGAIARDLSFFIYVKDWRIALPIPIILFFIVFGIVFFTRLRKTFSHAKKLQEIILKKPQDEQQPTVQPLVTDNNNKKIAKSKIILQPEYAQVPEANIDELFISHHIKLLAFLVSISIVILSSLFAFVLQYFVLAKTITQARADTAATTIAPTVAPTDTPIPTPTNIPVSKADIKIVVLNGSGKVGEAAILAQKLTRDGYTVLKAGNAQNDSTQTTITYPMGKMDGANQLTNELNPDYTNISQEEASDSATYTITLGQ